MTRRNLIAILALAFAESAGAVPTVSGDGACGIRAVDNESFVTCEGDRSPDPVADEEVASAPIAADFPNAAPEDPAETTLPQ